MIDKNTVARPDLRHHTDWPWRCCYGCDQSRSSRAAFFTVRRAPSGRWCVPTTTPTASAQLLTSRWQALIFLLLSPFAQTRGDAINFSEINRKPGMRQNMPDRTKMTSMGH
jgi:hypothetical protein